MLVVVVALLRLGIPLLWKLKNLWLEVVIPMVIFFADVVKSFDTVVRGKLDFVLGRLGLLVWFRRVYFSFHAGVRLKFKLPCGLGQPSAGDGGIPQGCSLSMIFIVASYLPWCKY